MFEAGNLMPDKLIPVAQNVLSVMVVKARLQSGTISGAVHGPSNIAAGASFSR